MLVDELISITNGLSPKVNPMDVDYISVVNKCKTMASLGYDHIRVAQSTFNKSNYYALTRLAKRLTEQGLNVRRYTLEYSNIKMWEISWKK